MVLELVAYFVPTSLTLFLTLTAIFDPLRAIIRQIRPPVCAVCLTPFPGIHPLALAAFPCVHSFALPVLAIAWIPHCIAVLQECRGRSASRCTASDSAGARPS
jgi:Na+/H+ antiporter NhaA